MSRFISTGVLFVGCALTPWVASAQDAAPPAPAEPAPAEPAPTEPEKPSEPPTDVTILGTRVARAPGSAHVIRSRELERFNYDDPHATLQKVPGVYVRGEDGVGLRPNISMRGVNPDRSKKLTLLEDGILFGPAPYSAPAAYYFPLITRMAQVRVIKGPAALILRPADDRRRDRSRDRAIRRSTPSGAIDLALGEYGYGKVHGYFGSSDERTRLFDRRRPRRQRRLQGAARRRGHRLSPQRVDVQGLRLRARPGSARQHELRLKADLLRRSLERDLPRPQRR